MQCGWCAGIVVRSRLLDEVGRALAEAGFKPAFGGAALFEAKAEADGGLGDAMRRRFVRSVEMQLNEAWSERTARGDYPATLDLTIVE